MYFHTIQTSTKFSNSKIVYHQWSEMGINSFMCSSFKCNLM